MTTTEVTLIRCTGPCGQLRHPTDDFYLFKGNRHSAKCKECTKATRIEYGKANPEKIRNNNLRKAFGITAEQYDEMFAAQGGVCAICGQQSRTKHGNGKTRKLAVDHDHETGEVRGLLCMACNRAMGLLKDNPRVLRRAADYLEQPPHRQEPLQ